MANEENATSWALFRIIYRPQKTKVLRVRVMAFLISPATNLQNLLQYIARCIV